VAEHEKPMRSDAKQNRDQLMEVARDAFIESGEISMTQLAKRAGVGVGTLYRHFPTREALVLAVYQHEIELLANLATTLLAEHPPRDALRLWLERLAYYGRMKYGVAAIIHGASSQGAEREAYDLIVGAIGELLKAGAATGVLKPDLDADDVLLIVTFLWRIPPSPDIEQRAARMLDIIIDGLSPAAHES
jgi:AcrR family transcriptional regulator